MKHPTSGRREFRGEIQRTRARASLRPAPRAKFPHIASTPATSLLVASPFSHPLASSPPPPSRFRTLCLRPSSCPYYIYTSSPRLSHRTPSRFSSSSPPTPLTLPPYLTPNSPSPPPPLLPRYGAKSVISPHLFGFSSPLYSVSRDASPKRALPPDRRIPNCY